jgi:hypothetical protein
LKPSIKQEDVYETLACIVHTFDPCRTSTGKLSPKRSPVSFMQESRVKTSKDKSFSIFSPLQQLSQFPEKCKI